MDVLTFGYTASKIPEVMANERKEIHKGKATMTGDVVGKAVK